MKKRNEKNCCKTRPSALLGVPGGLKTTIAFWPIFGTQKFGGKLGYLLRFGPLGVSRQSSLKSTHLPETENPTISADNIIIVTIIVDRFNVVIIISIILGPCQ